MFESSDTVSDPRLRVAVCLCDGDAMLLVQHLKDGRLYWLLPGGGVERGETLVEAAARELREETGYEAAIGPLLVLCEAIEPHGPHIVNAIFAATRTGGELRCGRDGRVVDAAWHPRSALPGLELVPPVLDTLLTCWDERFEGRVRVLGNVWRPLPPPVP